MNFIRQTVGFLAEIAAAALVSLSIFLIIVLSDVLWWSTP